ncbi:MAG: tetratricopeptide repeat protein [Gemmataceae bacterium]|nr:tetratricopeptide repeat protein [Gemmataceae bacterium]
MDSMWQGIGVACLFTSIGVGPATAQPAPQALADNARGVFKTHCYRCHGQNGANEGGLNYVADLQQLVGRRKVMPGNPAKSRLLKRMLDADDPMPPAEEKQRPSAADIATIRAWIEAGAPHGDAAAPPRQLTAGDMVQTIRADLDRANPRDRAFLRYFTLTHLHNAGLSNDELASFRHGLSKLVNSLSWAKHIVVPKVIDAGETILRIDLRDYQWSERTWDKVVARNPYGVRYDHESAQACRDAAGCDLPYVRGDWFVAVAARPPLYHEILELPASERELERLLRVDVLENIRQERVARAGFNSSGVSRNNRLIERHETGATVYWKSYDFAGNTGRQNLFSHPLGPGTNPGSFTHDGGEIIFTLPNGLQAFFLADDKGRRIDKGPTAIVSDPRRPDRAVENGLSCMSCHQRGIIVKADQVRPHVKNNAAAFTPTAVGAILALYPPQEKMNELMRADAQRFQEAVAKTGAPLSTTEPIAALAARFEAELDLRLAAAEAGITPAEMQQTLDRHPALAKALGPLRTEGGTVQRQVFVDSFPDLVDALKAGRYLASRSVAVDRLLRQGHALVGSDAAAALARFNQALDAEPDNPLVHAGRGDAFRAQGQLARAAAAYTEALRLDPRTALWFNNRGLIYHHKGELDKALADFDAALRLDPRFTVAWHNRGVAHFNRGDIARAIADYTEAVQLDPRFARAFNNRGYAYLDQDEQAKALADFNEALRLDPRLTAAWNNRGLLNLRQKRYTSAVADFSAAIKLEPKFAKAYYNRGIAHDSLGNTAQAAADRKTAVELEPALGKE